MTKITYYAATENMGDDVSDSDADNYREWALRQLQAEYPEASVEVIDKQSLQSFHCSDDNLAEEVGEFCKSLWDRCPGISSNQ